MGIAQENNSAKLRIGDKAPRLIVDKWLKGSPDTNLNDGKVRVVEFWATWCGPCKLSMPHLSYLAQQYKQVPFISITASESSDNVDKTQKFVESSGKMMDYTVAYAKPKGIMQTSWINASGRPGIPLSFVIKSDGTIGWFGHPLMGLEDAIKLALDEKLNSQSAAAVDSLWNGRKTKGAKLDEALKKALASNNIEEALQLNDELLENWPYMINIASGKKYALLTAIDPQKARIYGESLLKNYGNAPSVLRSVAATIFNGSDSRVRGEVKVNIKGKPDYVLAKKLLEKSFECGEKDQEAEMILSKIKECENTKS